MCCFVEDGLFLRHELSDQMSSNQMSQTCERTTIAKLIQRGTTTPGRIRQMLTNGEQHTLATHVWLIANPVGGGGKAPGLVVPLMGMLAKRFSDFNPTTVNGECAMVNTSTGAEGAARGETCKAMFTAGVSDGIRLATEVAREIAALPQDQLSRCFVIPVGGDGTLSEVIHGLSSVIVKEMGLTSTFLPNIVYLAAGTGADFARLGHCCRTPAQVMDVISATNFVREASGDPVEDEAACGFRRVDVGCVTHLTTGEFRFFTNEASVGLSNAVVVCVEEFKKKRWLSCLGGTAVFLAASAYELFKMKPNRFRMRKLPSVVSGTSSVANTEGTSSPLPSGAANILIPSESPHTRDTMEPASAEIQRKDWDQGDWVYLDSTALVFGNGQYFGGGMRVCPHGDPCDQSLAIASWGETICGYACGVPGIYNGNATSKWKTSRMFSGSRVLVELAPVRADTSQLSPASSVSPSLTSSDALSPLPPPHAFLEADGEAIGSLPVIIEISHQINFLVPLPKKKEAKKKQ